MIRRELIMLLGSAAVAWPLAARAQQPRRPLIGFLGLGSGRNSQFGVAFRQGLGELGFIDGQNVEIEFRWANFQNPLLPRLAAELVARQVDVIVTTGSPFAALAAKAATSTIPIAFLTGDDPVKRGLVASISRPGGNVTGVNVLSTELAAKRLDLLHELMPQATKIGYLSGPSESPVYEEMRSDMLAAGRVLAREIIVLEVRRLDFEAAFATLVEQGAGALIVGNYLIFNEASNREKIFELAARHNIPVMYPSREYAINGGLMSYDADSVAGFRLLGNYAGRILKGAKPADLPVQRSAKFEFVINRKTAKALGLSIPRAQLAAATEVID